MRNNSKFISIQNFCFHNCNYCNRLPLLNNFSTEMSDTPPNKAEVLLFSCCLPGSKKMNEFTSICKKNTTATKKIFINEKTSLNEIQSLLQICENLINLEFYFFTDTFSEKIFSVENIFSSYYRKINYLLLVTKSKYPNEIVKKIYASGIRKIYYYFPDKKSYYDDFYNLDEVYIFIKKIKYSYPDLRGIALDVNDSHFLNTLDTNYYEKNYPNQGDYKQLRSLLLMLFSRSFFMPLRAAAILFEFLFYFLLEPKNFLTLFYWLFYFICTQLIGFFIFIFGLVTWCLGYTRKYLVDFLGIAWRCIGNIYSECVKTYWILEVLIKKNYWIFWQIIYPLRKIYYFTCYQVKKRIIQPLTRFVSHAGNSPH